jgi:predicted nucleotidyltransferase
MQSEKIERLFVEFILNEIGPSEEKEKERNEKYILVKQLIENILLLNYPEYIPHIFLYGSFSIKTYLKDSDIDITIIFEKKENHEIIKDISNTLINNIFQLIKKSFEDYNNKYQSNIFNDINIILADVKLLKCQIDKIPLDISLNNFHGLLKIIFNNFLFEKIDQNKKIKSIILKRAISLIKAWCYYEGNLIGSNVGLMASCALELIILNIFNTNYQNIKTELDAFFYFFNSINEINFDKNIITLFGPINKEYYFSNKNKNDLFCYIENKNPKKEYLFNIEDINDIIIKLNKSKEILILNESKNIFQNKLCNIIDPINESNNLGKSINYHSFSKMKGAFQYMQKELNKIKQIKEIDDPFLYMNSLLKLFNTSLSMNFIGLFINYLNSPKIYIFSKKKENFGHNILNVDKNEVFKFNKLFNYNMYNNIDEKKTEENYNNEEDEEDDDDENEDNIDINKIRSIKNINIKYQKFEIIINYKIMNKLFEVNNKRNEFIEFFCKLSNIAEQNYKDIYDFMKKYKFIS